MPPVPAGLLAARSRSVAGRQAIDHRGVADEDRALQGADQKSQSLPNAAVATVDRVQQRAEELEQQARSSTPNGSSAGSHSDGRCRPGAQPGSRDPPAGGVRSGDETGDEAPARSLMSPLPFPRQRPVRVGASRQRRSAS